MLTEILQKINWVDLLILIICIRIIFIGVKKGFVVESFKVFGAVAALFVTLHYYYPFAMFFVTSWKMPLTVMAPVCFLLIWFSATIIVRLIREGVAVLFTIEAHPFINRWVCLVLAIVRAIVISSMVIFFLLLSSHSYIHKVTGASTSYRLFASVSSQIYHVFFDQVVVKFFEDEILNEHVDKVVHLKAMKKDSKADKKEQKKLKQKAQQEEKKATAEEK